MAAEARDFTVWGNRGGPYTLIDAVNATTVSKTWRMERATGIALQIEATGTLTGTMLIEETLDGTTYRTVADATFAAVNGAGSPAGEVVEFGNNRGRRYRATFTKTGGTGACSVTLNAMGV